MSHFLTIGNKYSNQAMPVVVILVVVLVLFALYSTRNEHELEADVTVRGSYQNGVFINNEWLSVEVAEVNAQIVKEYRLPRGTTGVVLLEVHGNTDVKMKLRRGDVITAINQNNIHNMNDFRRVIKGVHPTDGMFLDIRRKGRSMYVSISGNRRSRPVAIRQNPHSISLSEVAPILRKDIHVKGAVSQTGLLGKEIETWMTDTFAHGFYACPKCGTLVPDHSNRKRKSLMCPNCSTNMVLK
jgi:hypothetical protein